ncbi:TPA: hypothetical protein PX826_004729 [Escherichia coli]|nr:hypothetical protein [Escherichia coli]
MKGDIIIFTYPEYEDSELHRTVYSGLKEWLSDKYGCSCVIKPSVKFNLVMMNDVDDKEWCKLKDNLINVHNSLVKLIK